MTAETVVGSAFAYDCAVKPLTNLAAKWGKWLFTGCIPIEATIDNVQLYFSQFGNVLDVYLARVERKMCHRGFGFVTFSDEIQLSTLLRKYIGYVGRCVYVIMIYDRQVLWSNRYSCGYLSIKGRALEVSCAEWFGVIMSITDGLRETQEFMERSKQRKSK